MGHRLSKTAANSIAAKTTTSSNEHILNTTTTTTNIIPIPNGNTSTHFLGPTINLQIQESPTNSCVSNHITTTAGILQQQKQLQHQYNTNNSISSSLTSVSNLSFGRQIIIKIQLAKMENGNETTTTTTTAATTPTSSSSFSQQLRQDTSLTASPSDCNLNSTELATTITAAGTQFLNLTLNSSNSNINSNSNCNSMPNSNTTIAPTTLTTNTTFTPSSAAGLFRTAGSSLNKNNNYLNSNNGAASGGSSSCINNSIISMSRMTERPERFNSLQFNDEIVEQNIGEIVEYCEVLEDHLQQPQSNNSSFNNTLMHSIAEDPDTSVNVCCRRKSKSLAANGGSSMSSNNNNTAGAKTKSRCRKCSCRDAFKRFLDPSHSRSSNKANKQQKEQKRSKSQDRHSINNPILNNTDKPQHQRQPQRNSMHSTNMSTSVCSPCLATSTAAIVVPPAVANQQVSLWSSGAAASGSDVIIPLTTPAPSQFVVVQCAILNNPSHAALHPLPTTNTPSNPCSLTTNNNLLSITTQDLSPSISTSSSSNDLMVKVPSNNTRSVESTSSPTGPIVHSQVDFVHYLVPDLERITNSSFYWGKMDRYEAERLLEGKPEGTFLLRDSAQEEFLFSVTFRKYGRSLHARIEQSDHRFSFDCHDPCVFTAPTVTGLLEHYKDPACVMFFEPMLTIPLHRRNCFSLQKLCRATIVSTTSYDGINELELPSRLKSYLKEYHYKQKLRVKSNEPQYTLHCK